MSEKEREYERLLNRDSLDGIHCPKCDHPVAEPINDIWKDPSVKERLREGVPADDIYCLRCPDCSKLGYYNQGSGFWCRFCDKGFTVDFEDGSEFEPVTLADTVTETTDGYDNQTR